MSDCGCGKDKEIAYLDRIATDSQVERDRYKQAAEEMAKAATPLLEAFKRMDDDTYKKTVLHQTFESASENWDKLLQEPLEFGPLIKAVSNYSKLKEELK